MWPNNIHFCCCLRFGMCACARVGDICGAHMPLNLWPTFVFAPARAWLGELHRRPPTISCCCRRNAHQVRCIGRAPTLSRRPIDSRQQGDFIQHVLARVKRHRWKIAPPGSPNHRHRPATFAIGMCAFIQSRFFCSFNALEFANTCSGLDRSTCVLRARVTCTHFPIQ